MTDGGIREGLFGRVRRLFAEPTPRGVHAECRRCGRTLREPSQHCPDCGAADIARYEL